MSKTKRINATMETRLNRVPAPEAKFGPADDAVDTE